MADERDHNGTDTDFDDFSDDPAAPLRPFSRRVRQPGQPPAAPAAPSRVAFPGEAARRVTEPAQPARRLERNRPGEGTHTKHLIVGREIELRGEIRSCERLTVEGRVEAALSDARIIEIAPSGFFKGSATVDEADISGHFEGDLVAREKLTVRAQGRINGSIRYGRIVIESGGEITGDMQSLATSEAGDNGDAPGVLSITGSSSGEP